MSNGDGVFAPQEAPFARIFDIGVGADARSDAFPSANRLKLLLSVAGEDVVLL
jgi:hypothetical protein